MEFSYVDNISSPDESQLQNSVCVRYPLFSGAGASKAVGIGDLKELTDKVKVRLKEEGYGDLIQHITETLEKANFDNRFFNQGEIDIELIFSVLSGLSNPIKGLKDLGPYAVSFISLI
jgi:hypothetical protein